MEQPPAEKTRQAAPTTAGRTTLALASTSFVLELATVITLLLDQCSLATILAILAALFGGATVYRMATASSGDKPDPWGYDPPPTR